MLDPSAYTLTNGGSGLSSAPISPGMKGGQVKIEGLRFKFQDDSTLPIPRGFTGGPKKYRAGRGSTVPLDLGSYA